MQISQSHSIGVDAIVTRLPALMYHAVTRVPGRLHHLGVTPNLLAAQLAHLSGEGFALVGMTEAVRLDERGSPHNVVALTFDDAYADFLDAALPILQRAGARATVYVPTAYVGGVASWLDREAATMPSLLSWSQLRECVASGIVEVGSHSHTHRQLDTLPLRALISEIVDSRQILEDALQIDVKSFCYPHGYHSGPVRRVIRVAGYDNACEVGRRLRSARHRWSISRLAVGPSHEPSRLAREVRQGGPLIIPSSKRLLQPAWRSLRRHRGAASGGVT